ncbi:hypothetical protein C2845_PM13G11810 [Panicum miliaceum]|uniref:Uncharacterized protein n=1 Tax=Panicum miliaceum TaxID=4540 RepID=A0A3L6RGR9_PANMI|nr:hypothetical protein C2845_PM13G11810 [Panicum miliaceum]
MGKPMMTTEELASAGVNTRGLHKHYISHAIHKENPSIDMRDDKDKLEKQQLLAIREKVAQFLMVHVIYDKGGQAATGQIGEKQDEARRTWRLVEARECRSFPPSSMRVQEKASYE